ncbi:MAG: hypothetical protein GX902_13220, partial [Lentisphaerae bacterium]|nr:hypothetical protein [Lentisphaerota bacterium]
MSNRVWERYQNPKSAPGIISGWPACHSRLLPRLLLTLLLLFALKQRCRAELQSC